MRSEILTVMKDTMISVTRNTAASRDGQLASSGGDVARST